jgi:hypothetical protein
VRTRLLAAAPMALWIVGTMVLLVAFRGVPWRLRGQLIIGSLLVMIVLLTLLRLRRSE